MPHLPKPTPAASEDYLTTIYRFTERGRPVIAARLAEIIGVSAPAAFGMLKRMARDELVKVSTTKEITLNERGRQIAEQVVRRHRLAERMLTELLGMDWQDVYEEAHLFEHAISPRVEQRLVELLHRPTTCPHGFPIPGHGPQSDEGLRALGDLSTGGSFTVDRVSEDDPALLQYLGDHGFVPGAEATVTEVAPFKGTISVAIAGKDLVLGQAITAHLIVRPL